jgi:ABC-type polysaccharide/polyol phosphate export permease
MGVVLMVVFWMTPIVYSPEHIPARLSPYLAWSPTAALTSGYRDVLLLARPPSHRDLALIAGSGSAALVLGFVVSKRLGRDIVSEI